jgi:hypothetical protein
VTAYATPAQLRAYGKFVLDELAQWVDDDVCQAILDRASADVDAYLQWPVPDDTSNVQPPGRIDLTQLSGWETWCLGNACVNQAMYRLSRSEQDLLEGPPDLVSAGGSTFATTAPPPVGAMTILALTGCPSLHVYRTGLGVSSDDVGTAPDGNGTP